MPHIQDRIAHFWTRVAIGNADECWLWLHACDRDGYGQYSMGNWGRRAHRYAYEIVYGPIPDGFLVCHSCDIPACVNPAHLWVGTPKDNALDRNRKGRGRYLFGDDHPARKHPENLARGEQCGNSKLTADQVREIRQRYLAVGISMVKLGMIYGITGEVVHGIVHRRYWKHII